MEQTKTYLIYVANKLDEILRELPVRMYDAKMKTNNNGLQQPLNGDKIS